MSRDPIDELGSRLFQAARQEAPPEGGPRRTLEAAEPELSVASGTARRGTAVVLLLAAALGSAVLLLRRHEEPAGSIGPEASTPASPRLQPAPPPPSAATSEATAPVREAPRAAPAPLRSAPATLSQELDLLRVAESALGSGDTRAALAALDRYEKELKGRTLRAEATLLRIETLSRAGQPQAAAELARRFVQENPTSPLVDRARSFIDSGKEKVER